MNAVVVVTVIVAWAIATGNEELKEIGMSSLDQIVTETTGSENAIGIGSVNMTSMDQIIIGMVEMMVVAIVLKG